MLIRQFKETDLEQLFTVVNEAAHAYRGVIPADRSHDRPERQVEVSVVLADRRWMECGEGEVG